MLDIVDSRDTQENLEGEGRFISQRTAYFYNIAGTDEHSRCVDGSTRVRMEAAEDILNAMLQFLGPLTESRLCCPGVRLGPRPFRHLAWSLA